MARELQARHFLVLAILVSFFFLSSTIQARTLHAKTRCHHAIMNLTGSHGVTGYYITEAIDPIFNRRELSVSSPGEGGSSPGDGH
ncbi:hypothetical protein FH972_007445 [Carpinus fangiana]|uniref:Dirigent protein n=1 Tax=Carpinus fangiana TaxID=176857 RepID=A0A5N6QVP7_9ROSI|nr:hypothetical protein FH972_007445 [Carpinus fangiana]